MELPPEIEVLSFLCEVEMLTLDEDVILTFLLDDEVDEVEIDEDDTDDE